MNDYKLNNLIDQEEYNKYLDSLKQYYTLKNKYESNKQTIINKIMKSKDTIEVKKQLFSKQKIKCVNCGNVGGTVFSENNKMLTAICGNVETPCDLKIEIVKFNPMQIDEELADVTKNLDLIKRNIILTKLDFLFKYIEEDKAVEKFDEYKDKLGTLQEKYNSLYILYKSVVKNEDIKRLLEEKELEKYEIINEYRTFLEQYKMTGERVNIKEAVELYVSKLIDLNKNIQEMKYKHSFIENSDDGNKLIQKRYDITDLEIIQKPEV